MNHCSKTLILKYLHTLPYFMYVSYLVLSMAPPSCWADDHRDQTWPPYRVSRLPKLRKAELILSGHLCHLGHLGQIILVWPPRPPGLLTSLFSPSLLIATLSYPNQVLPSPQPTRHQDFDYVRSLYIYIRIWN